MSLCLEHLSPALPPPPHPPPGCAKSSVGQRSSHKAWRASCGRRCITRVQMGRLRWQIKDPPGSLASLAAAVSFSVSELDAAPPGMWPRPAGSFPVDACPGEGPCLGSQVAQHLRQVGSVSASGARGPTRAFPSRLQPGREGRVPSRALTLAPLQTPPPQPSGAALTASSRDDAARVRCRPCLKGKAGAGLPVKGVPKFPFSPTPTLTER